MPEFQTDEHRDGYIAALLAEREVYESTGNIDAARGVDAELSRVGHESEKPAAEKRPAKPAAETRA